MASIILIPKFFPSIFKLLELTSSSLSKVAQHAEPRRKRLFPNSKWPTIVLNCSVVELTLESDVSSNFSCTRCPGKLIFPIPTSVPSSQNGNHGVYCTVLLWEWLESTWPRGKAGQMLLLFWMLLVSEAKLVWGDGPVWGCEAWGCWHFGGGFPVCCHLWSLQGPLPAVPFCLAVLLLRVPWGKTKVNRVV